MSGIKLTEKDVVYEGLVEVEWTVQFVGHFLKIGFLFGGFGKLVCDIEVLFYILGFLFGGCLF